MAIAVALLLLTLAALASVFACFHFGCTGSMIAAAVDKLAAGRAAAAVGAAPAVGIGCNCC